MKKLIICMVLIMSGTLAFAQFEKNTWFLNPSLTGMDLSFNKNDKTHFGLEAMGGAFMADNLAVLLHVGGDFHKRGMNTTTLGAGARYYLDNIGIYFGAGLKYKHYSLYKAGSDNDVNLGLEVGYAYFISKNITLEPGVYYDQSFTDHKAYSRFGIKIGVGVYF